MGIRTAKKTAWKWFSLYIRTRDAIRTTKTTGRARCCTCDRVYSIKEGHAGHFIAGRHDAVLFDEQAVHFQCVSCNTFQGGKPSEYARFMTEKYGEGIIERKFRESWEIVKYTEQDLKEIAKKYRIKYRELLNGGA